MIWWRSCKPTEGCSTKKEEGEEKKEEDKKKKNFSVMLAL